MTTASFRLLALARFLLGIFTLSISFCPSAFAQRFHPWPNGTISADAPLRGTIPLFPMLLDPSDLQPPWMGFVARDNQGINIRILKYVPGLGYTLSRDVDLGRAVMVSTNGEQWNPTDALGLVRPYPGGRPFVVFRSRVFRLYSPINLRSDEVGFALASENSRPVRGWLFPPRTSPSDRRAITEVSLCWSTYGLIILPFEMPVPMVRPVTIPCR
jgi:hypothetical protein